MTGPTATAPALGFACVPTLPPERLREFVTAAEDAGLDEVWVWEDCFAQSGLASAAAALAWTDRIRVGIGLMPTPLRAVALTAMEIATLERMFPGRFVPGIGHGVQSWMGQAGVRVSSPLTLLREYAGALRELLAGAAVSVSGRYVDLDDVTLTWPAVTPPALAVGGEGPRSVDLAAELGEVFLLSACRTRDQIRDTRARMRAVHERIGRNDAAPPLIATQLVTTGPGAADRLAREARHWTDADPGEIGAAGDAATVAAYIRGLVDDGVTSVVVQPTRDEPDPAGLIRFVADEVRPLLSGGSPTVNDGKTTG